MLVELIGLVEVVELVVLIELSEWEIDDCTGGVLDTAWLTAATRGEDVGFDVEVKVDDVADDAFPYALLTIEVALVGAPPAATQTVVVMSMVLTTSSVTTTVTRSRFANGTAAAKLRRPEKAKMLDCFMFGNECQMCCNVSSEGNCEFKKKNVMYLSTCDSIDLLQSSERGW